jgi:hypothetical protein
MSAVGNFHRVKDQPNLRKNPDTGVVVNVSDDDYHKYIMKREQVRKNNARLDRVESELSEVKGMLRSIIDKLDT